MLLLRPEFVFVGTASKREERKRICEGVSGQLFFLARGLSADPQTDSRDRKKYNDGTFKLGIQTN